MPTVWRATLAEIADRLAAGDYALASRPANVRPVDADTVSVIKSQISGYGDELTGLLEETWKRSIYIWMDGHWEVLVDLCTKDQGVSDLGLFVKVFEQDGGFVFEVFSVHVP